MRKSYGRRVAWPPSAGIREIIQNLFDAILSTNDLEPHEVEVVEIREIPGGDVSIVEGGAPTDNSWSEVPGAILQFVFMKKEAKKPTSKTTTTSKKLVANVRNVALGWIHWKMDYNGRGDVEFYNTGEPITFKHLRMGESSKADDPKLIGQHGDGLKLGESSRKFQDDEHPNKPIISKESMLFYVGLAIKGIKPTSYTLPVNTSGDSSISTSRMTTSTKMKGKMPESLSAATRRSSPRARM